MELNDVMQSLDITQAVPRREKFWFNEPKAAYDQLFTRPITSFRKEGFKIQRAFVVFCVVDVELCDA
jgi:hypothetical protein